MPAEFFRARKIMGIRYNVLPSTWSNIDADNRFAMAHIGGVPH